jgi:asparagine synthase (glutamine-hydrolysing)
MASSVGAAHHEVELRPADLLRVTEFVPHMDEPFCDAGINVASWLLGDAAHRTCTVALTGDGGDELFAGHPVYQADRLARWIDPLPRTIKAPILSLCLGLGDSDQKVDLRVKMRRLAEGLGLPRELGTQRWRTYYHPASLASLLHPDLVTDPAGLGNVFRPVSDLNHECDGSGSLNRSLYADYLSVVDFYLRRNELLRSQGVEVRAPFLDVDLVDWCARVPANLKVRGGIGNKYLLRRAAANILPREIAERREKLGHTVPLKEWIRGDAQVRELVLDHLSPEILAKRGLFRAPAVEALVVEHLSRRRNNAHRLWTLALIEMWLRERERQPVNPAYA